MEMLLSVIELPVWAVIAAVLAGAAIGMLFLTLAILLLGHSSGAKETKLNRIAVTKSEPKLEVKPDVKAEPVVASAKQYKPVPPVRQHYWYYVSGVSGRFPTLREALSASGVKVPADKMLDWKKLSPDIRAGIKRVDVDDKQPADEPVAAHKEEVPVVAKREDSGKNNTVKREPGAVVKKSIGHGAFVTIKKKEDRK